MAINIRFDYYNLNIDKQRKRQSRQSQQFFGGIELADFCTWINDYYQANKLGEHGIELYRYAHDKKWIKWVNASFDNSKLKLLCSFNDKEVDPRLLANNQDNVLSQPIPDETYGQRTLLHIVISPEHGKICVQNIIGFTKENLQKFIIKLLNQVAPNDTWTATDPVTEKKVLCKPCVELNFATTDDVLEVVKRGGLRGVVFSEQKQATSKFDREHHITQQNTEIIIRIDGKSFIETTTDFLFGWTKDVEKEKSTLDSPRVSLIIQDPQTKSEVRHEILNGVIKAFSQKCFLDWNDRDKNTHRDIAKKIPTPIAQFYARMIENF